MWNELPSLPVSSETHLRDLNVLIDAGPQPVSGATGLGDRGGMISELESKHPLSSTARLSRPDVPSQTSPSSPAGWTAAVAGRQQWTACDV